MSKLGADMASMFSPPALKALIESPVFLGGAAVVAAGVIFGGMLTGANPWAHQMPQLKWTAAGVDMVKAIDKSIYEDAMQKPQPGDTMTSGVGPNGVGQLDLFFKFNIFTDQLLDRGLVTGAMQPRKYGLLGKLYDFLFMAPVLVGGIGVLALTSYALGRLGVLHYSRPPAKVAIHFFGYLYVLLHTMFVTIAHLGMKGDAAKVEEAIKTGEPQYHKVMWSEQAAGNAPKGAHPFDAHTWPPLVYIPAASVPLYQRGYILADLPGIALLAIGSSHAYAAMWACYLSAALTDHLFLFGGSPSERLKTVSPIRGINMLQYSFWVIFTHLTSPASTSVYTSSYTLLKVFAVAAPVHLVMMYAIGARKSRRPGSGK